MSQLLQLPNKEETILQNNKSKIDVNAKFFTIQKIYVFKIHCSVFVI